MIANRFFRRSLFAAAAAPLLALAAAPAAALGGGAEETELTEIEIAAIQQACEDLSELYGYYLDTKDYVNLSQLFTEDGVWEVLGNRTVGRQAIHDRWKSRTAEWAPTHGRLHQMSNQYFKVIDRNTAIGHSYVTVYMWETPNDQPQSLAPVVISKNDDEFVRTEEGWRIKRRSISTLAVAEPRH